MRFIAGMTEQQLLIRIGANITKIRAKKGFTLSYIGDLSGIGKSNIIPITQGRVNLSIGRLLRLAQALEVNIEDLLK